MQRGPTRIRTGIAAESKNRRRNLRRRHRAVEWLGVYQIAVIDRQSIDFVAAVELYWAGIGAAPSADRCAEHCAGARIHCDYLGAENPGDARRRSRQRQRVGWKDASANGSNVDEIGWRCVKDAQAGAIVVAQRCIRLLCCWSGAGERSGAGAYGYIIAFHTAE